jgi:hypothetical protein
VCAVEVQKRAYVVVIDVRENVFTITWISDSLVLPTSSAHERCLGFDAPSLAGRM